jgi:DNA-nicking Smr family endonuclease
VSSPDDEERKLFREAVRGARPLRAPARAPARARPPPPKARFARAEREAVLHESLQLAPELAVGDELSFRRPGVPDTVLRRLRGGHYRIEAETDLHGLNVEQGREQLRAFLKYALARELRCLRIVHGKGLRSGQRGPVLKQTVNSLLRQADPVLAFASARAADGGTGATLVLLGRALKPAQATQSRAPPALRRGR